MFLMSVSGLNRRQNAASQLQNLQKETSFRCSQRNRDEIGYVSM